jgi:hypothetical protein
MFEQQAAEAMITSPLLVLVGLLSAFSNYHTGYNQDAIKENDKKIIEFQVSVPEQAIKGKNVSDVLLLLNENGGNKTPSFTDLSNRKNLVIISPYKKGPWEEKDLVLIDKIVKQSLNKVNTKTGKVYLIGIKDGGKLVNLIACDAKNRIELSALVNAEKNCDKISKIEESKDKKLNSKKIEELITPIILKPDTQTLPD